MVDVTSPYFLAKLRPDTLKNPQVDNYFTQLERIIQQGWNRSGGGEDLISAATTASNSLLQAALNDIREQIGSGDPLTIDDTGITIDSTFITIDRTEI